MFSVQFILCSVLFKVFSFNVQCIVYSVQLIVFSVQCSVFIIQFTVYSVQCSVTSLKINFSLNLYVC